MDDTGVSADTVVIEFVSVGRADVIEFVSLGGAIMVVGTTVELSI